MTDQEEVNEKHGITMEQVNQAIKNDRYDYLVSMYLKREPKKIKKYHNLKYKDFQYTVNQDIGVCALNDDVYSAKLIKILCIRDPNDDFIPIIQVQWYYKKQDLKLADKYMKCLSEKELFFSTHTEYLPANKLQCEIRVLTFEDYSNLEYEEETTFFTRAVINLQEMQPNPAILKWPKVCICRMPQNPDLQMIKCDKCDEWFHLECVNLTEEDVDKIEIYKCPGCQ